jgi:flagellar biosynthesis chaperone FliJ
MLRNELYNGCVKRGETRTFVPALQIIDDDTFNRVTELRNMRNKTFQDRRRVPMTTKSAGLLSGNIFCGHCGRRMAFSGSTVHHRNQKGEIVYYNAAGYCCRYGQYLGGSKCQQRYISSKIDDVVRSVLQQIFERIRETPPADYLDRQHERAISEIRGKIKTATCNISKLDKELSAYKNEVIKVIQGNSGFTAEVLNQLIHDCEDKISEHAAELERSKSELDESASLYEKTKEEHVRIQSWSEIFDKSSLETQKMAAASLISAVRVSRGYRIEIDLNLSVKEFAEGISFNNEMLSVS